MKLFGGAITADIPRTMLDASDLREVPDHQELFVGTSNGQNASLIIELLETVDKPTLLDSLAYHIEELHRVSSTEDTDLKKAVEIEQCMLGQHETVMRVDLLTHGEKITTIIFALFQMKQFNTDVLVTCTLEGAPGAQIGFDSQMKAVRDVVSSFKLHDPRLFMPK